MLFTAREATALKSPLTATKESLCSYKDSAQSLPPPTENAHETPRGYNDLFILPWITGSIEAVCTLHCHLIDHRECLSENVMCKNQLYMYFNTYFSFYG